MTCPISRRDFLGLMAAATVFTPDSIDGVESPKKPDKWAIGCFNRPWSRWSYDEALQGIKSAGYHLTGHLGSHKGEHFISPGASEDYLRRLKQRVNANGMNMNVAWLRTNHETSVDETVRSAHNQIDNAVILGVRNLMTTGVNKPERYEHYYRVMAEVAVYAEKRNIQIVLKPHGGCSASADEILRCIDRIDQKNFRVWYDAGNIIHYTGKDPVADVARVAPFVTGFCAKDCAKRSGDVMIQFGTGKVDFLRVFAKLKDAGFRGPIMVECCAGKTRNEVTTNAKQNREFLEKVFASL